MAQPDVSPTPPDDAADVVLQPADLNLYGDMTGTLPVPSRQELNRLRLLSDQDTLSEQEIEVLDPITAQNYRPLPPGTSPFPLPDDGIDLSDEISPVDFITPGD